MYELRRISSFKYELFFNCLAGKLFVRVPEFWTADWIFNVAKKLGPIDQSMLAQ